MKKIFVALSMVAFLAACSGEGSNSTNLNNDEGQGRFDPDVELGSMTDSRDGQVYRTVKIGNQTWMAENLNYYDVSLDGRSWCFGAENSVTTPNCAMTGRLYTWAATVGKAEDVCGYLHECDLDSGNIQGICPDGWHLPSKEEWSVLVNVVGGASVAGMVLKSSSGWDDLGNGSDDFGFSALPAGFRNGNGSSDNDGIGAYFWSSTEYGNDAYYMYLFYYGGSASIENNGGKYAGYSVRCLVTNNEDEYSSSSSSEKKAESSSSEKLSDTSSSSADKNNCRELLLGREVGWDWEVPKECRFNPDIEYDSMTDDRDGQVYRTVTIDGRTWMAENLNFDPGQGGSEDAKYDWSWCYDSIPENCYVAGRLYTWAAAVDSVKLATDAENPLDCGYRKGCGLKGTVQGICPSGWHLPSKWEWESLPVRKGENLMSRNGWNWPGVGAGGNGKDTYGFSALPVGSCNGYFSQGAGSEANFWSATECDTKDYYLDLAAFAFSLDYYGPRVLMRSTYKDIAYSVRCVKD